VVTAEPFVPLRIGQLVRRRSDPKDTPLVGIVGGLLFGDQNLALALVRWRARRRRSNPRTRWSRSGDCSRSWPDR
jgi:hypothetical protein